MRILLTGSSGFIGQHLYPKLQEIGKVFSLKSDLTNHRSVYDEVMSINPDIVIHLAARTEVQESFYEQINFTEINYVGTVNLIESCRSLKKLPYFIFASTMEVYGWQPISDEIKNTGCYNLSVAFDENTIPNPNAPYAVAKYACEKYLEYANRSYDLEFTAVRQTNSYGRSDNNYFVTEQIISQMLNGDEINLGYSDPYRNFIFIDDLIDAWLKLIEKRDQCNGRIFTIGPDDPRKIRDCADLMAKKLNWNGKINWNTKPPRFGEIYWLNSNYKKFNEITGWKPKISYSDGIDRTIELWKRNLNQKK